MRRVAIPVLVLSVAILGGAACSSERAKSEPSTTTTTSVGGAPAVTTTTSARRGTTSSTGPTGAGLTDQAFVEAIDQLNVQLDFAKDSCDIRKLFNATDKVPDPANTEQAQIATAYLVGLFSAVGSTVEKESAATAKVWLDAARHIAKYMSDAKYAPAAIQSDLGLNDDNVPGFDNAAQAFIDATNQCPGIQS